MARYIGLQMVAAGFTPKVVNSLDAINVDELFTKIKEQPENAGAYWDKYLVVGGEMFRIEPVPNKDVQLAYERY